MSPVNQIFPQETHSVYRGRAVRSSLRLDGIGGFNGYAGNTGRDGPVINHSWDTQDPDGLRAGKADSSYKKHKVERRCLYLPAASFETGKHQS